MALTADHQKLIRRLAVTWPAPLGLGEPPGDSPIRLAGNPLQWELEALQRGEAASLPHFEADGVRWLTVAPDAEALQAAIDDLRAWIIPSFGWEDLAQPFVAPGEGLGTMSEVILRFSPAGYFRWHSTRAYADRVVEKLQAMRRLAGMRPEHIRERVPSLYELRQQFGVALTTGDHTAAEVAIRSIDHHQLDSAVNTHLMWVRLRDRFREYAEITADPHLSRLIQVRLPHVARLAIIRAFHATFLNEHETAGALTRAASTYVERVHDKLGGLLEFCKPQDGPDVARCLAYRAWHNSDAGAAKSLLDYGDGFVRPLLEPLLATARPTERSVGEELKDAIRKEDIRKIQEIGIAILSGETQDVSVFLRSSLMGILRTTLEERPNEDLQGILEASRPTSGPVPAPPTLPQSWSDFLTRLRQREWGAALRFLSVPDRPDADTMTSPEIGAIVESLEELITTPALSSDPAVREVADTCLRALIEDFVSEPLFPRSSFTALYLHLLRLWSLRKSGSTYTPDGHVLLVLAAAVLQRSDAEQQEIAAILRDWWEVRRVRALLPFVLEVVELLAELTSQHEVAQGLWIEAADLVRRDVAELSTTEFVLWRTVGLRLGLDRRDVQAYLGDADERAVPETDPVADAGLKKVAIVSLHEKPALQARELIGSRAHAEVIVVSETSPAQGTRSAQTADVVLFVWSANKHAVFRAFDAVRDRVVYVQGTGAGSIVLALERWAARKMRDLALSSQR